MKDLYCEFGEYRGYMYCVKRTCLGTVCCYVNVQRNAYMRDLHFVGADFSAVTELCPLHGGVTYFRKGLLMAGDVPCCKWPDDIVVGCDYGHFGDMATSSDFGAMTSRISEQDAERELKSAIDVMLSYFDL